MATKPPSAGEMTQLAAMLPSVAQSMAAKPAAAMPAPATPPTTACVVDTGAPIHVARLIHRAEEISAASISRTNTPWSDTAAGLTMPLEIVVTTSAPAISAPALSNTAAIASAPPMVSALAPTAGPTLLATSLAPMLSAM